MFKGYKVIGLCITKVGDEGYFNFIKEFSDEIERKGYRLFIYQSSSDMYLNSRKDDGDKAIYGAIPFHILDAVVIWEDSFRDKSIVADIVGKAHANGIPALVYGRAIKGDCNFGYDRMGAYEKLIRHVVEYHGVTDTCFVAGIKGEHFSEERLAMYRKVLESNGIPFEKDRVYYGDYWSKPAEYVAQNIIARGKMPRAVICANDVMAIAICGVFEEKNIRVPEDVIVTGFDGITGAYGSRPAITTCAENHKDMAEQMMSVIENIWNGEQVPVSVTAKCDFDILQSCGCKPAKKILNPARVLLEYQEGLRKFQGDERNIYETTEQLYLCSNANDFKLFLATCHLNNMSLLLNESCFDESLNPATYRHTGKFDRYMLNVYQTDKQLDKFPRKFDINDVVPDGEEIMKRGLPAVFSSLSFYGQTAGMVITYSAVTLPEYRRIQQLSTLLNSAICNYMLLCNLKYTTSNLRNASEHDYLTGLLNRTGLAGRLPDLVSSNSGMDKYVTVVSMDLNNLKVINDTKGHEEGDRAIRAISDAMRGIPFENKLCARYGGDEMVVCFVSDDKAPDAKIRRSIGDYLARINADAKKDFDISVSLGIYTEHCLTFDFQKSIEISDKMMYEEKMASKNAGNKKNR